MANSNLPVNIKHLNELADKLDAAANADCESINNFFKRGLDQLNDLIKDMTDSIKKLNEWADLIDFNPFSFIKKLIKKLVGPALAAAIAMAIQLAMLLKAIIKLIAAVQNLVKKIIGCVVSNIAKITAIVGQLTSALKGALAKILNIKALIKARLQAQLAAEVNDIVTFVNQTKANVMAQINSANTPDNGDGSGSTTANTASIPPATDTIPKQPSALSNLSSFIALKVSGLGSAANSLAAQAGTTPEAAVAAYQAFQAQAQANTGG